MQIIFIKRVIVTVVISCMESAVYSCLGIFFFWVIRGNLFAADIAGQCKGVNVIMYLSDVSLFVCCFIL